MEIIEILFIFAWIFSIYKFHISGRFSAIVGFVLLFFTMICNIFSFDIAAGIASQFVFILFSIAFIQQFIHFLKYENKK